MTALLLIPLLLGSLLLLFPLLLHLAYRAPRIREQGSPADLGLPYSEHRIPTLRGRRLFAWLIPAEQSRRTLVLVHGWGANAEMMLPLAEPFHRAGLNVLLYDARNHGRSDSDSFSSLPRFAEDLSHVLAWLRQRDPHQSIITLGHSVGAAAVILAASRGEPVERVIAISGFAHPRLMMNRHLDRPWLPRFLRPLIISYVQWVIGFRFDDIAPMNRIHRVPCPVLLAHGTDDTLVPIEDMHRILERTSEEQPVEFVAVAGAQHDSVEHFRQHADRLLQFIDGESPG